MFDGLADRIKSEIVALAPPDVHIKVVAPFGRKYFTYQGAVVLSTLYNFE